MDCNNYIKIVHALMWHDSKILLSKRLKKGYHQNFWSDAGGKKEKYETLFEAVEREVFEETNVTLDAIDFTLVDCFIYPDRELKTFLFEVYLTDYEVESLENVKPHKHSDWQWFTIKEALKLKLMPSVRYYLENKQ